jgi:hypothetical protein
MRWPITVLPLPPGQGGHRRGTRLRVALVVESILLSLIVLPIFFIPHPLSFIIHPSSGFRARFSHVDAPRLSVFLPVGRIEASVVNSCQRTSYDRCLSFHRAILASWGWGASGDCRTAVAVPALAGVSLEPRAMSLARRETGQDEGQKAPLSFRERGRG